jgi:NADH-quinone oxidoreductase subunit L
MNIANYFLIILLLPLLGFTIIGLWGKKYFSKFSGIVATLFLFVSTLLSLFIAYNYFFVSVKVNGVYEPQIISNYEWLHFTNTLSIRIGIVLDSISAMMLVIVTFVSLMVHVFSLGYMKGEERYATYFSFLQLFTFSMLGLVVASNIFQMYIFWELVGVSSYLLISFYFNKPSAVAASKKAFIVTRFADLGFLIGILILGFQGNSFDFSTLIQNLTNTQSAEYIGITTSSFLGFSVFTWALCLVFIGGAGKSAMFPLHIWLPDAMEGPTPVSALIHAATMVVAGVFLVARMFPLFYINHFSLQLVMWVGAFSAIFAAIIACTQTDIKRVLAYSTMSQIGYMMFALGVSNIGGEEGLGYTASMFHLFTHAFFKSLLFLGAGAIIHFVHSNDMNDMGGLRKYLPITHISFLIACLSISGIPPFSGFFSKEEILLAAWNQNKIIYSIALITSGLTAFYMFRLYFVVFTNKTKEYHAAHKPSLVMNLPLIMLAALTLVVGFLPFSKWVSSNNIGFDAELHFSFSIAPILISLIGIFIAYTFYFKQNNLSAKFSNNLKVIYTAALHKFYIDEVYTFITKKIVFNLIAKPSAWIDKNIVDGTINGIAKSTAFISTSVKKFQSGKVQQYMLYFFSGILSIALILFYYLNK